MRMKKLVATVWLICIFLMVPVFEVFAMQIQIQVGVNGGSTITLEVGPSYSIATLKSMVQEAANISLDNRVLLFGDEELSDDTLTVEGYGITDGATIIIAGPYTVTLNMGGHGNNQTVTVKHGDPLTLTEPSAEGFSFLGWYKNADYTEEFISGSEIYADTVLYAKCVESHTVTIKWNGHGNDQTLTVNHGDYVVLPNPPEAEGFTFGWWYTDEALTESFDPGIAITSNMVLYTEWFADCTVTFNTNGIGDTVINPQTVKYGETVKIPEPPVAEGYTFEYWYWNDSEGTSNILRSGTSIYEDITAYAHWAIKAENTVKIDNITFRFDNYPVPDQPLTTDGIYIDAGEMTSQLKLTVPSWSEWDYYAFDENRLPVTECKPSADSGSVMHFRAGKYYMYWCRVQTPGSMDPEFSLEVPPYVVPLDANFTVDCPDVLDFQWWPWASWVDPETEERSAIIMEIAIVFKAPEYKVIEDEITDTTFEAGTDDTVTLHFNGDLALFDELVIDGNVVPKDQYTLTEGSTIVTLKSSYLETLGTGDHTVTAVYNTNMDNVENAKDEVSAVITVKKSEDKPAEPDSSSGNGNAPAPVPTATPTNTSGSPNTGDITSITGYLVSGALSLARIVGINKKRKK